MAKSVDQIDRELKACVQRRKSCTREISKLSGQVIRETKDIARLLEERLTLTHPSVPDTAEGADLPASLVTS